MEKYEKGAFRAIYDNYRGIWTICGLLTSVVVILNSFVFEVPNLTAVVFAIYMAIIIPCGIIAKKVDNFEKEKLIAKLDKEFGS